LAATEHGVGAEGIEPWEEADVAAFLPVAERAAEGALGVGAVAASLDSLGDVRLEFLIDLADESA
jgi:hypothetical protein